MMGDPRRVRGITVAALTQGAEVPSTRFRVTQHVEALARSDVYIRHLPARFGSYPPGSRMRRVPWGIAALAESSLRVIEANRADVVLLQRELLSTLHTAERFIRRPYVFDVDDAIFTGPRGWISDRLAKRAALTICGNSYLADHYGRFGPVAILPTAVDTTRFIPARRSHAGRPTIGWSGSSSGFPYLYGIESALEAVFERVPDAVLDVVADRPPIFRSLPVNRVRFRQWSEATEVEFIQRFSVGLMPLEDTPWTRGKCSFKMLTYMAVGIPVVVSPVGMNTQVLAQGLCGFAAHSREEWVDAISTVLADQAKAQQMGVVGRCIVEANYSAKDIGAQLSALVRTVAGR